MDYLVLQHKKERYQQGKDSIPELTLQSFEQAFEIEYTHNSTALEGNTLTLMETKLVFLCGFAMEREGDEPDRVCGLVTC